MIEIAEYIPTPEELPAIASAQAAALNLLVVIGLAYLQSGNASGSPSYSTPESDPRSIFGENACTT